MSGSEDRKDDRKSANIAPSVLDIDIIADKRLSPTVRNDAANRLLVAPTDDFCSKLIQALSDESEELTWRNYSIQFLTAYLMQKDDEGARIALFDAALHPNPELSGCAIWNISRLSSPDFGSPRLNFEEVSKGRNLAIKGLSATATMLRICAVQACGRLKIAESATKIREIAGGDGDIMLRCAAVAVLGELGDESSREVLTLLRESKVVRIANAAKFAINKLDLARYKISVK